MFQEMLWKQYRKNIVVVKIGYIPQDFSVRFVLQCKFFMLTGH